MNVIKNFKSRREGQRRNGSLISLQQSNDNIKIYVLMLVSFHKTMRLTKNLFLVPMPKKIVGRRRRRRLP